MSWADARAEWMELEQMATYARRPDGKCWKCSAAAGAALCDSCNERRLEFMRCLGGRAGSHNVRRSGFRNRAVTPARPEWMPYKESEDRL